MSINKLKYMLYFKTYLHPICIDKSSNACSFSICILCGILRWDVYQCSNMVERPSRCLLECIRFKLPRNSPLRLSFVVVHLLASCHAITTSPLVVGGPSVEQNQIPVLNTTCEPELTPDGRGWRLHWRQALTTSLHPYNCTSLYISIYFHIFVSESAKNPPILV